MQRDHPATSDDAGRAVVIGGGFGGMLAAAALATHLDVVILERDPLPTGPAPRRGLPQAHHPHGLLHAGATALEAILPGIHADLHRHGAQTFDFGEHVRLLFPDGWSPPGVAGVTTLACSRALLDARIRAHVTALPKISVQTATATGLLQQCGQVIGVRTANGPPLRAQLVVDASGRSSRLSAWLRVGGLRLPEPVGVPAKLSYVTRRYRLADGMELQSVMELVRAPDRQHAAAVWTIEDEQAYVTLIGADGVRPPYDESGLREYLKLVRNPLPEQILDQAEPIGQVHRFGPLDNRWQRYHRQHNWPGGVIALGDALAVLNPVYGQGMTIAAVQAQALSQLLAQSRSSADDPRFARAFQRRAAAAVRIPWLLATSSDIGWTRPPTLSPDGLRNRLVGALLRRMPHDPDLYRQFLHTQHLTASPAALALAAARSACRPWTLPRE